MKAGSAASCSRRWRPTRLSSRTGSWKLSSQIWGSTQRNRSRVRCSQDQRRLNASSWRGPSASGRRARTVKLRSALMALEATGPGPP